MQCYLLKLTQFGGFTSGLPYSSNFVHLLYSLPISFIHNTMKQLAGLFILLFCATTMHAQAVLKDANTSTYKPCKSFRISKPLRDLPSNRNLEQERKESALPDQTGGNSKKAKQEKRLREIDPTVQQSAGTMALDTPLVNFEGGSYYRPDATGAAGPNNYVQGVNLCNFNIYDKLGHLQLATDMTTLGGSCSDDPIVLYDKFADRWLLADVSNNYMDITIAISTTPDPTGSYYIYNYAFPVMPDFPKVSVWTDGYYVTYRDINNDTVGVGVLERAKMLVGNPSAGIIITRFPSTSVINANTQLPGCPKILSCDGALPAYGKPNYLMYFTNINCGDATNSIVIYKLATDTALRTCHLSLDTALATLPFNAYFTGYGSGAAIAEPGGQGVWSLDGMLNYRVPYIRFTGYNSCVLSTTVNLHDSIAGIRWWELRQNDTTRKWSIHQQATFGPNDTISRWNASIAMNLNGDISLAYNVTNKTNLYPGIRYTGRLVSDPIGQMTFAEQTAIRGRFSYPTQWGDYSESTLDPDGHTFWHTNQYIIDSTGSNANTRIFSFQLSPHATGIREHPVSQTGLSVFQTDANLNVTVSGLTNSDKVAIDLFDLNGKQISSQWITPVGNKLETKINTTGLAKGIYLVRAGNLGFQKVNKICIH